MEIRKAASNPLLAVILTLTVSLGLNLFLGLSEFEEAYRTALVNKFGIVAKNLKAQVENSMSLGKPLHLFGDAMEASFAGTLAQDRDISHIYVTSNLGAVLYSTRPGVVGREIPLDFTKGRPNPGEADLTAAQTHSLGSSLFVSVPLYRLNQFYEGHVFLEFREDIITRSVWAILADVGISSAGAFGLTLAGFWLSQLLFRSLNRPLSARGTMVMILAVLILSQALFALGNNRYYAKAYTSVYDGNMIALSQTVKKDLDKVFGYGMKVERLKGAEAFLAQRIQGNPECANIYLMDESGQTLYQAGVGGQASILESSASGLRKAPLPASVLALEPGTQALSVEGIVYIRLTGGYLALEINQTLIGTRLWDQGLDSITIAVVSLIMAYMLLELLRLGGSRDLLSSGRRQELLEEGTTGLRFIRLSTFIFTFGAFVPLAFLPQHIQGIYSASPLQIFDWNTDIMVSVPIAAYMVGITVAMILTIFFLNHLSLRNRYVILSLLFIGGTVMTALAGDILYLILARFLAGMGFGGALLATTSLVTAYTSDQNRSTGFGISAAGFAAATLSSVPIGGVIVNRLGTQAGLYTAVGFGVLFLIFILVYLQGGSSGEPDQDRRHRTLSFRQWIRILTSRHILTYTFLMNIPFQFLYWGLFQYVLPLYMSNSMGISEANIGRILSLFCVISLLAAFASRFADRLMNDKLLLSTGALVVGASLLLFNLFPGGGLLLFMGVITAMGIQNLFVDSIEEVYISKGKVPVDVDEETLLQSYKTVEKVLSVFVPTLSGLLILAAGFGGGLFILGLYTIAAALAFLVLAVNGRTKNSVPQGEIL